MYCTVLYRYESRLDQYNASIAVIWDRDNVMDSTNITLYKCGLVGSYRYHPDCSLCMTRYCTVLYCPLLSYPHPTPPPPPPPTGRSSRRCQHLPLSET